MLSTRVSICTFVLATQVKGAGPVPSQEREPSAGALNVSYIARPAGLQAFRES